MELTLGKNHILEGKGYLLGAEYECGCEQLKINLTYDLLLDKWAYLEFITSDGEKFTTPRLTNENGQVSYTVPSGLLKEGYVKIQAVFRDANGFVWKSLQRQFLVDKSINATEEYPEVGADWLSQAQTTLDAITIESDKVDAVLESETKRAQEAQLIAAAEATRVENENARKNNETARVEAEALRAKNETSRATAEKARAATEQARVTAENARVTAENTRSTNENARVTAESDRASAEQTRKNSETARSTNEANRQTAETERVNNETQRNQAEALRAQNETSRANAEALRASAEDARKNNESARTTNEQTRQTNEVARQSAEQARQEEFNGWTKKISNLNSYDKRLINLEAAGVGTLFETQVKTGVGYRVTVPTNALPYATIHKLGGKSIITNNVFNYYELINVDTKITSGSFNVTSNGNTILTNEWVLNNLKPNTPYNIGITFWRQLRDTIGYTNVSYKKGVALVNNSTGAVVDMLFNNEDTGDEAVENKGTFTTPADLTNYVVVAYTELWADTNGVESAVQFRFANMYISETDTEYLPYDASGIVNADVNQISTRNVYQIPQAVRELDGYGIGIDDTNYNYIDFDRKVFVKNVEVVDKELTVLATPIETDISAYITDNYINVNNASNVVFLNSYDIAVPYELTFTVKL